MSRFVEILHQTSERLTLPQPARSRVLLEIAADMDDLFVAYRERGLGEDEAREKTLEDMDLSDEALSQLAQVHAGPVRLVLDRLSSRTLQIWERALLILVVVSAFVAGDWLFSSDRLFRDAGIFAWPVLVVALAALVLSIVKFYQLFLKQDHSIRALHGSLDLILGLSVFLLFLGFAGGWVEVWRLKQAAAVEPLPVVVFMLRWAMVATALLQLSLGLGILNALVWFGLAGKVSHIERHEAEVLLNVVSPRVESGPATGRV